MADRVEVRVRPERRWNRVAEDKSAIVREGLEPGTVDSALAKLHGVATILLSTRRTQMLAAAMTGSAPVQIRSCGDAAPFPWAEPSTIAGRGSPRWSREPRRRLLDY